MLMKVLKKLSEFWNVLHQRERIQDDVQEVRVKTELSFTDDTVMILAVAKWLMTDESHSHAWRVV